MKHNRSIPSATVIPVLVYPDVREAVAWLEAAFGFVERVQIGEETHRVMVRVDDATAHCEHARAHGARILMEPTDFEYGERQYEAEDPFGHRWTFSETLRDVAPEEWGGSPATPARGRRCQETRRRRPGTRPPAGPRRCRR
jgi:uncharacterized glyoxalase superfamily protein PhnB